MDKTKFGELEFIDKQSNCIECEKQKEITVNMGLTTIDEWRKIIPILDKYGLSRDELNYIYNFYNRVFGTKKVPGCGKCFRIVAKNLKNRWDQINK